MPFHTSVAAPGPAESAEPHERFVTGIESKPTLTSALDARPLTRVQYLAAILCGLVAVLDGFDVQSIAFAAPSISQEWAIPSAEFGLVFSAGLSGMVLGALSQGPVADRIGRKPALLACVVVFGVFTLTIAFARSLDQLLAARFAAGVGMGAAVPNFIALTSEYAPQRLKSRMIIAMNAGFPFGGFLGGILSAQLLTEFGWRSIFVVGGLAPLLLLPLLAWFLPESILFEAERAARRGEADGGPKARKLLSKLQGKDETLDPQAFAWPSRDANLKPRFAAIFEDGRAFGTVLLWAACFASLILFYALVSWLPSLLTQAGLPPSRAVTVAAILNLGAVVGGFCLGWVADRFGPRRALACNYLLAGCGCVAFGLSLHQSLPVLFGLGALLGFCCGGGQLMLNALSAMFYPTHIRSTGLGAAGMAGRLGSLTGPMVGGALLGAGLAMSSLFAWLAAPALVTAISAALLPEGKRASR